MPFRRRSGWSRCRSAWARRSSGRFTVETAEPIEVQEVRLELRVHARVTHGGGHQRRSWCRHGRLQADGNRFGGEFAVHPFAADAVDAWLPSIDLPHGTRARHVPHHPGPFVGAGHPLRAGRGAGHHPRALSRRLRSGPVDAHLADLVLAAQHPHRRIALAGQEADRVAQRSMLAADWLSLDAASRAPRCGRGTRPGAGRTRSRPTAGAAAARWPAAAARAQCSTLVASTTVSRRRARRSASAACSSSKAASVAPWSWASSATKARSASDESTSVGRKWRAAKVVLPAPLGPISTHQRVVRQAERSRRRRSQRVSGASSSAPSLRTLLTAGETG